MSEPHILFSIENGVSFVTLNRPGRHNSLTPELLDTLCETLDRARSSGAEALVLAGAGTNFSTGGDVAAFAELTRDKRRAYADKIVSLLNAALLKLLNSPFPVIVRVQGAATGGSAGFVFASDIAVMAANSYLAPYYVDVGFAPDGGWTALLPELVGRSRASAIQMLNARIGANEAKAIGLATAVASDENLDEAVSSILASLRGKRAISIRATKALLYPDPVLARIEAGLEAERRRFVETIVTEEAETGMARFLKDLKQTKN